MDDKNIPKILEDEWSLKLRHFVETTTKKQSQWLLSLVENKNSFLCFCLENYYLLSVEENL